jgi:phenylalanyl-tRNA synthetase alpha chain
MVELRERERKILFTLKTLGGKANAEQLMAVSGLPDTAVMRAALTLKDKSLVHTSEKKQTVAELTAEGEEYANNGLPERKLVRALEQFGGKALLRKAAGQAKIRNDFLPIALGWIQRKKWAKLDSKNNTLQLQEKPEEGIDEKLLNVLEKKQPSPVEELGLELQDAVQILKGRKLLKLTERTERVIELTSEGRKTEEKGVRSASEITQINPELIVSGKWRRIKLQRYNVEAPVAETWPGKKHPYLRFLDDVRAKLIALGFKEMAGTAVETAFFNFDALYTPQGHPARESSGVYYVKQPKHGSLDKYEKALANVEKTHENGWKTGSIGWKHKFSREESARLILRSHTTCLSARTLLSRGLEIPGMYFSIGRCYRPEVLDRTHLTEFNQVEGIVVDKDLTLRNLLGILEKFAIDIAGADEAKFVPDYFPFTEPSVELRAYREGYGWVEFGGSGIFRPEVTLPLGIKVPVLAWGLGVDRLFMLKAGIDDIRQIFSTDLDWLRREELV